MHNSNQTYTSTVFCECALGSTGFSFYQNFCLGGSLKWTFQKKIKLKSKHAEKKLLLYIRTCSWWKVLTIHVLLWWSFVCITDIVHSCVLVPEFKELLLYGCHFLPELAAPQSCYRLPTGTFCMTKNSYHVSGVSMWGINVAV